MKPIRIIDEMYNAEIYLIVNIKHDELVKFFLKKYKHQFPYGTDFDGMHYLLTNPQTGMNNHFIIIYSYDKKLISDLSILDHEVTHLMFSVLDIAGIKYDTEHSEEAYTYYHAHILTKCYKVLHK